MFFQKKSKPAIKYRDHSTDPAVLRAAEEAREFLTKHPFPAEWFCNDRQPREIFVSGLPAE